MQAQVRDVTVNYVEHGNGRPAVILHGAGVDHHETEACFEPAFAGLEGWRRVYPDLPGMGRTVAPDRLRSAADIVDVLLEFASEVAEDETPVLIGHSAGGYFAQGMAAQHPEAFAGLALVCPLLSESRGVSAHRMVVGSGDIGDDDFRGYFVVQTPEMLDRYERHVAPGVALVDEAAQERIGERWMLPAAPDSTFGGPTLIVAGRGDSTVGYRAAVDLLDSYPRASLVVIDEAGHALPHEQPEVLRALIAEWIARVERAT